MFKEKNFKTHHRENNFGASIVGSNFNKQSQKIKGILTSQVRVKPSDDTYMVFLRPISKDEKHSLSECETTKCQACEIPVIFRWVDKQHRFHEMQPKEPCFNKSEHWQKPKLNKGDKVLLTGEFSHSKKSNRPSFTCYSIQTINDHE